MIRTVAIRGLGPHRATALEFDPRGHAVLEGPSQSGKSTLIEAVCWAIWGTTSGGKSLPEALVHDGDEQAEVTVTLGSGTVLTRRMRRAGRKQVREIARKGEDAPTAVATEAAWKEAIGPLGKNPDLARVVMAPMAWTALAEGPGGGRPLRDLLAGVLPSSSLRSVVAELVGSDLKPGDSISEKEAYARRSDANRERDELTGQLRAAEEDAVRLAQLRVDQPDPADARRAKAVLDAEAAWAAWAPVLEWDRRSSELGPRPDTASHEHLVTQRRAFRDELARKLAEVDRAQSQASNRTVSVDRRLQLASLESTLAEAERRASAGTKCPECGQDVPNAEERIEEAARQAEAAQAELAQARAEYEAEVERQTKEIEAVVAGLGEEYRRVSAELQKAEESLTEALRRPNPAAEWDAGHRVLGPRPLGVEPTAARPTPAEVDESQQTMKRLQVAAGERKRTDAERKAATERVASLRERRARAEAEAQRLDRLLEAIRRAPSVVASRQLESLGDLGPVTIQMPESGAVAIEVLVDGRPWWTASRGRLVVADLYLRAALRRALKLPWLVLFVDNVQDWSGELPPIAAPTISLRTASTSELIVGRAA